MKAKMASFLSLSEKNLHLHSMRIFVAVVDVLCLFFQVLVFVNHLLHSIVEIVHFLLES